uniref:Uncharacterized protein n=1 Tax=Aegilops tauschii subsp. strangulata TaxID=200361 RepID=A0A453AGM9_AEGTS
SSFSSDPLLSKVALAIDAGLEQGDGGGAGAGCVRAVRALLGSRFPLSSKCAATPPCCELVTGEEEPDPSRRALGRGPHEQDPSPPTAGGAVLSRSPFLLPFSNRGSTLTTPLMPKQVALPPSPRRTADMLGSTTMPLPLTRSISTYLTGSYFL